jgi:hypothetical protein
MQALPATPGPGENVPPWSVRELLLDVGRQAALQLSQWQDALDLNAELTASMRGRRAPATAIARVRFNEYGPLLYLDRTPEALELLLECRQVFQDARDIEMLGRTLNALANVEDGRGHGKAAIGLERGALRYGYLAGDVTGIKISYHNLGNYLRRHVRQPGLAIACHLTAALIFALTGAAGIERSVQAAAASLRESSVGAEPPAGVAELCRRIGDIPGTDPAGLIARLSPDPGTAETTLRELIARALAESPRGTTTPGDGDG